MANTFELIASSTVGSGGTANITFSSIAGTWTDLLIKLSAASNRAVNDTFNLTFNGSGSSYSGKALYGNGTAAASFATSSAKVGDLSANGTNYSNVFANDEIYVPNYTSSNYKSVSADSVSEANATGAEMTLIAALWSNTDAITSITIEPNVGSLLLEHSTAYLYGVNKNA